MKSLLNALQEGRLVELPATNKEQAIEYLAHIIEAIPDVVVPKNLEESIKSRECNSSSYLGFGVACPHVRIGGIEELLCAVGWSPEGIDYGATDGYKVHLVIMYYIPLTHMNVYLKEISFLSKAILSKNDMQKIVGLTEIHQIREKLLDWVSEMLDTVTSESKAKIIRLESKQAVATSLPIVPAIPLSPFLANAQFFPISIILEGTKLLILGQMPELIEKLEKDPELILKLKSTMEFRSGVYLVAVKSVTQYACSRVLYECLTIVQQN